MIKFVDLIHKKIIKEKIKLQEKNTHKLVLCSHRKSFLTTLKKVTSTLLENPPNTLKDMYSNGKKFQVNLFMFWF